MTNSLQITATAAREFLIYNHILDLAKKASNLDEFKVWLSRERDRLAEIIEPGFKSK